MLEKEVKYLISQEAYEKAVEGRDKIIQTNYYFFTSEKNSDLTLRIRQKKSEYELTMKIKKEINDDIFISEELNKIISLEEMQRHINDGISGEYLKKTFGIYINDATQFCCKGSLITERTRIETKEGFTLELDKNEYLGVVDYEIECECINDEQLHRAKAYIKQHFETSRTVPKTIRFLTKLQ
ncbi:MAG: CYTH domain-containing protein [Clostridia bacterium]|nr:CYTH domain-containing protein [Clostridia bacterium]